MGYRTSAKQTQNYSDKPTWPECRNCRHFRSTISTMHSDYTGNYTEEKNLRCFLGGFAVKKLGTCDQHEPKS